MTDTVDFTQEKEARERALLTAESDLICGRIVMGDFDGQPLADMFLAIRQRLLEGDTGMRWRIEWSDIKVSADDFTLEEAAIVERLLQRSWHLVDPALTGVKPDAAVIYALLMARMISKGTPEKSARARLAVLRMNEALDACDVYGVKPDPFDRAGSESTSHPSSDE